MAGFDLFRDFSLFRARSDVKSKVRGDLVRHHVVSNPYHAVSIQSHLNLCGTARKYQGQRFLAADAPKLPLAGCRAATCTCRYVHHDDRREGPRRASDLTRLTNGFWGGSERRDARGRRINDH
jgi:hypothetical protein